MLVEHTKSGQWCVDLLICNSAGRLEPHARAYLGCWRQLDSGKASISAFKRDANPNLTTDLNHRSPSLGNSACTSGINNTRLCLEVASLRDNASIWRKLNCIPQRALIDRSTMIVSSPRDAMSIASYTVQISTDWWKFAWMIPSLEILENAVVLDITAPDRLVHDVCQQWRNLQQLHRL